MTEEDDKSTVKKINFDDEIKGLFNEGLELVRLSEKTGFSLSAFYDPLLPNRAMSQLRPLNGGTSFRQ